MFRIKHESGRCLILSLKRFEYCSGKQRLVKLDKSTSVRGSESLQLGYAQYSLLSFIVHIGTAMGGHYYAFVKHPHGTWFKMNDTDVTQVETEEIYAEQPYILFYERIDRVLIELDQIDQRNVHEAEPKMSTMSTGVKIWTRTSPEIYGTGMKLKCPPGHNSMELCRV